MEDPVSEVIQGVADLTPVLETLEQLRGQLEVIAVSNIVLCGVVLGLMAIFVLAVMFR